MRELLIGSGKNTGKKLFKVGYESWDCLTTLDLDADANPDVIHDLNVFPYPFAHETFDEIHAYNVLEHQGSLGDFRFFFDQWNEFGRITKPGGAFFGIVPHSGSVWLWGDPGHTRTITPEMLSFLNHDSYGEGKTQSDYYKSLVKYQWQFGWHNAKRKGEGWEYSDPHHFMFTLVRK